MALMRSSTTCLAPSPMASIAITEATPMTMPSSVSTVRKRLARSARTAVFAASSAPPTRDAPPSSAALRRDIRRRRAARQLRAGIADDPSIADLDDALRLRGDVERVRDEDHGVSAL